MKLRLLVVVALAWTAAPAAAHPMAPALLELTELGAGKAAVLWKTPRLLPSGVPMEPVLPDRCRLLGGRDVAPTADAMVERWSIDCGAGGIVGLAVGASGLAENAATAVLRISFADGRSVRALLTGGRPAFEVPPRESRLAVLLSYLALGVEHLAFGLDHLLFVFGLLLLIRERGRLLAAITSFTAGHSVTLSLATLGIVAFPTGAIEAAIAASIVVLAAELENRRAGKASLLASRPWLMALGFGLLHGFGFAGALADVGLPEGEIPLALLGFNAGIEVAQIAAVVVFLGIGAVAGALRASVPLWLARAPAYGLGTVAAYWCVERTAALFGV